MNACAGCCEILPSQNTYYCLSCFILSFSETKNQIIGVDYNYFWLDSFTFEYTYRTIVK
jgi:hypothetical protein